jgi:hypothetical protein
MPDGIVLAPPGMNMRKFCVALIGALLVSPAFAQTADGPKLKPQDTWTFRNTHELGGKWSQTIDDTTVVRVSASGMLISIKQDGSTAPPVEQLVGVDWSRSRSVNGEEKVVNRPLNFPLSAGKTWDVDYSEDNPNRAHSKEQYHTHFSVVGWEDVTVPAGTFRALKIEADGQWTAVLAPSVTSAAVSHVDQQGAVTAVQANKVLAKTVTGRLYKAFWYVPEAKRFVKSVEEYYGANGVRNERFTGELESFKVGD